METYEATVSLSPQQAADKIRAHILNSISGECLDEARRQQLAAYYTDADGMALQSPLTLGDIAHWVEQALEATRQGA